MGLTSRRCWTTTDGTNHFNENEAKVHQAELDLMNQFRLGAADAFKIAPECERLVRMMIGNPEFYRDQLNKFIAVQRRQKKLTS